MPREHPFDPFGKLRVFGPSAFGAFDRYAAFTDVAVLKEWSAKPLRKSVRVNALKCSVERFQGWVKEKGWTIEQVPWCREGFFVDRPSLSCGELRPASRPLTPHPDPLPMGEGNEREALGKDLLHLIGGFYIQEAASMLPVELLDPQPGDAVLDMSAAPGSKTTQIAAGMKGDGVIIANDIQEHRLWTLKSALHRSGVTNAIVTKKVGQWFGKHMTERFDRVLCDAPCTAQGTVRKDSDALSYCGKENIEKMARLQTQLLEAAIHATKVGGRIVYSTCTLTLEENEGVAMAILEKFAGKVEVVDPHVGLGTGDWDIGRAIEHSFAVQRFLGPSSPFEGLSPSGPNGQVLVPMLRLWPQTYDTEGFFCAVLQKVAPTRAVEPMEEVSFQEERLSLSRQKEVGEKLEKLYGTDFFEEGDVLFQLGEQIFLANADVASSNLPVQDYALGLPFAKLLADGRVRLSHEVATLRGVRARKAQCSIDDAQLVLLLEGKDAQGDPALRADVLLLYKDFCIGRALAKAGLPAEALSNVERAKKSVLKNNLPRWMVR